MNTFVQTILSSIAMYQEALDKERSFGGEGVEVKCSEDKIL